MEYLRVMKIPFPRIVPPAMSPRSLPGIRFAVVLGLLAAVPGLAGMFSRPESFGTMVRNSAYVVRVRLSKPASVAKTAIDPETRWETPYEAGRYQVLEILAKPSGAKVPRRLLVVDRNLKTFEDLGKRGMTKILISYGYEPAEGEGCREGEEQILFLAPPNRRGEYPEALSGACLSARHRGRIDRFLAEIAAAEGHRERACGTSGVCTDGLGYGSTRTFTLWDVVTAPENWRERMGVRELFRRNAEAFEQICKLHLKRDAELPRLVRVKLGWGTEGTVETCALDSGTTGAAALDSALLGTIRKMRWDSWRWGGWAARLDVTVSMRLGWFGESNKVE